MLSMTRRVLEAKSMLESKSRNFDPFTIPSRKAVTTFALKELAARIQVQI
jgi:hypothetical protein